MSIYDSLSALRKQAVYSGQGVVAPAKATSTVASAAKPATAPSSKSAQPAAQVARPKPVNGKAAIGGWTPYGYASQPRKRASLCLAKLLEPTD